MATSHADDPQNRPDVWQMYRKRVHATLRNSEADAGKNGARLAGACDARPPFIRTTDHSTGRRHHRPRRRGFDWHRVSKRFDGSLSRPVPRTRAGAAEPRGRSRVARSGDP